MLSYSFCLGIYYDNFVRRRDQKKRKKREKKNFFLDVFAGNETNRKAAFFINTYCMYEYVGSLLIITGNF